MKVRFATAAAMVVGNAVVSLRLQRRHVLHGCSAASYFADLPGCTEGIRRRACHQRHTEPYGCQIESS